MYVTVLSLFLFNHETVSRSPDSWGAWPRTSHLLDHVNLHGGLRKPTLSLFTDKNHQDSWWPQSREKLRLACPGHACCLPAESLADFRLRRGRHREEGWILGEKLWGVPGHVLLCGLKGGQESRLDRTAQMQTEIRSRCELNRGCPSSPKSKHPLKTCVSS